MTTIYNLSDLYVCNKEDVIIVYIMDEKITKEDLLYIFTFLNLEYLILVKNYIEEIPEEISNLKKLVLLNIQFNNITKLPNSIKDLNLYRLNISCNNINLLQDEIFELTNLQYLIINNNRITQIPKKICKLNNLRELIIDNIDKGSSALYFLNKKMVKLDISNFHYLHNKNSILDLPDEIANLQYLANCYVPKLKENYKIFGENMIIFDNKESNDIFIPENIVNLVIFFKTFHNRSILNYLNNLPNSIESLSLSNVDINIKIENLPTNLKELYFYTEPYCGLFKPYTHWPRHILKEDILQIKIPFGCSVFLNDNEIEF